MEPHEETYKGRRIRIQEPPETTASPEARSALPPPQLSIDGVPIKVLHLSDGTYISESYAFDAMPTLLDLARRQIDLSEPDEQTTAG